MTASTDASPRQEGATLAVSISPAGISSSVATEAAPTDRPAMMPVNVEGIPAELKELRQWVAWRYHLADDKWTKKPCLAKNPRLSASTTDPATWCSFGLAFGAHKLNPAEVGIGFVFARGGGLVGIDLDRCRDESTGELTAEAAAVVEASGSYAEVSPSGTGVKLWVRGKLPTKKSGSNCNGQPSADGGHGGKLEVYQDSRFFTVTGHRLDGAAGLVAENQELVDSQWSIIEASKAGKKDRATPAPAAHHEAADVPADDAALIERIERSRQGAKFRALWGGDISGHEEDHSAADLALCSILCFWCGPDAQRIDRLFRRSGLMRAKWDERRGDRIYGEMTVAEAISRTGEFYDWSKAAERLPAQSTPAQQTPPLVWKPFPVDVLPSPVAQFVAAGSETMGCDPTMIVLPMLSALASAIGAWRRVKVRSGWHEPSVIWSAVVSPSGTLKSPAFDLVMWPLKERQTELIRQYQAEMEAYQEAADEYDADLSDWKKHGRKAGEERPKKPEPPTCTRLYVSDTTVEALADRLNDNPAGLLVARDELAGWLGSFDAYRAGKGAASDAPKWLEMHRAQPVVIDRKAGDRKLIFIPRAAVSVCGGIQPEPLRAALGRNHFEDGLAARLLLAMPPRKEKQWREETIRATTRKRVADVFSRLWGLAPKQIEDQPAEPIDLPLSPDAKKVWIEFYNEHARHQNESQGDLAAAFSKLEGCTARLALIFELVQWADSGAEAEPSAVGVEAVRSAVATVEWFRHEVRRIYQWLTEPEADRQRRELVEWIDQRGGAVSPRDLQRGPRLYREADAAEAALVDLVKAGLGEWEPQPAGEHGGRPSRVFRSKSGGRGDKTLPAQADSGGCVTVASDSTPENNWGEV